MNKSVNSTFLSLEDLLPEFHSVDLRGAVDRYGFSSVLARKCGYTRVPRCFANWMHGWIWSERPTAEILGCSKLSRDTTVVVSNESEEKALLSEGFIDVRIGGLPFAYIPKCHNFRNNNSLLAFPPHSAEIERLSTDQKNYFDYLESIKIDFEDIFVSIYYLDLNTQIHRAALARGLKIIQGARPDDANALIRVRSILDRFKYVTSNVMGSHMLYSLYASCNFSFSGPFYSYDESVFMPKGNPHLHSKELVKESLFLQSESYIREKFQRFFVQNPMLGYQDIDFANYSIGERFVMNPREIQDALGWTMKGQIIGYAKGAARRIQRILK